MSPQLSEVFGIQIDTVWGESIYVGHVPGRNKNVLAKVREEEVEVLAYFSSTEKAQTFVDFLHHITDVR